MQTKLSVRKYAITQWLGLPRPCLPVFVPWELNVIWEKQNLTGKVPLDLKYRGLSSFLKWGGKKYCGGHNLLPLVEIGLTVLPKTMGVNAPPGPPRLWQAWSSNHHRNQKRNGNLQPAAKRLDTNSVQFKHKLRNRTLSANQPKCSKDCFFTKSLQRRDERIIVY